MKKFWLNFMAYEAVWFSAVIGAGYGQAWPGLNAALLLLLLTRIFSLQWRSDFRLAAVAIVCGQCLDGTLAGLHWVHYRAAYPFPVPLWIFALWASFALTLNHSLAYLKRRPWLASLLGAVAAPMSYWGAARGWHAVDFEVPIWRALVFLAISWALVMPLLTQFARRWETT